MGDGTGVPKPLLLGQKPKGPRARSEKEKYYSHVPSTAPESPRTLIICAYLEVFDIS